jgi:hypothetical protein
MSCDQAELPGKQFVTFDSRTDGPTVKLPYQTTYNDLTLSFFLMTGPASRSKQANNGLWVKRFFDQWMELVHPQGSGISFNGVAKPAYTLNYRDQYSTRIVVTHYGADMSPTYAAMFDTCYPIGMDNIPMTWADENIMKLSMTFAYSQWAPVAGSEQTSSNYKGAQRQRAQSTGFLSKLFG